MNNWGREDEKQMEKCFLLITNIHRKKQDTEGIGLGVWVCYCCGGGGLFAVLLRKND